MGETIALITARGGSTRIPRKNLLPFCGLPLVAWSIIQAKCARFIDRVYLTTDDDEIAEVGMKHGATVLRRPVMDNGITAGVPFRMALQQIEDSGVDVMDIVSMLPTSALKKPDDLDNMITAWRLRPEGVETITTAAPIKETFIFYNGQPYYSRFKENKPAKLYGARMIIGDKFWQFSRMAGGWGIATRDFLHRTWWGQPDTDIEIDTHKPIYEIGELPEVQMYALEEWQLPDIDYIEDAEIAAMFMEHFILKGRGPEVYYTYRRGYANRG